MRVRVTEDIYAEGSDDPDDLCIPKGVELDAAYVESTKSIWVEYEGQVYALSEAECQPIG